MKKRILRVKIFKNEEEFIDWQKANYELTEKVISMQVIPQQVTAKVEGNGEKYDEFIATVIPMIVVQYSEFMEIEEIIKGNQNGKDS